MAIIENAYNSIDDSKANSTSGRISEGIGYASGITKKLGKEAYQTGKSMSKKAYQIGKPLATRAYGAAKSAVHYASEHKKGTAVAGVAAVAIVTASLASLNGVDLSASTHNLPTWIGGGTDGALDKTAHTLFGYNADTNLAVAKATPDNVAYNNPYYIGSVGSDTAGKITVPSLHHYGVVDGTVDTIGSAISNTGSAIYNAPGRALDAVFDAAGNAGGAVHESIASAGNSVNTAVSGAVHNIDNNTSHLIPQSLGGGDQGAIDRAMHGAFNTIQQSPIGNYPGSYAGLGLTAAGAALVANELRRKEGK